MKMSKYRKIKKHEPYENIPRQIRMIADHAIKRCYVRYNPKDQILNYFQRPIKNAKGITIQKSGVIRRVRIDRKNGRFMDVDNKCEVHIWDCGHLLATQMRYMRVGIPTYWKPVKKDCTCKTRYIFYVTELDDLLDEKLTNWTIEKQCKLQDEKTGIWKIVPQNVPILLKGVNASNFISIEFRNNTIKEMYAFYGVPPKVLANMFGLSERWTQRLVKDLRKKYKKVKKSAGLKKVGFEYFED
jgi:hypothetical protein